MRNLVAFVAVAVATLAVATGVGDIAVEAVTNDALLNLTLANNLEVATTALDQLNANADILEVAVDLLGNVEGM